MPRIHVPDLDAVPDASRSMLDAVGRRLGFVPNMFRAASASPAVLTAVTGLSSALSVMLDVKTRERIAVAVSQANGCEYCVAAHTYLAVNVARLSPDEVALNRQGYSADPKADAAIRFALAVVDSRGHVDDTAIAALGAAGFREAQMLEIVVAAAQTILNNLLNNVVRTEVDTPFQDADAGMARYGLPRTGSMEERP